MKGYPIEKQSAVNQMIGVEITGNVIPIEWFKHIKYENGKPHSLAILILADIVYWYRPIEARDELTGKMLPYRKKFAADLLQRDYNAYAAQYGYTKNQIKDAFDCLEAMGLVKRHFRDIVANGRAFNNVLFIELIVNKLVEITYGGLPNLNQVGMEFKSDTPTELKAGTNTETTPPENLPTPPPQPEPEPQGKVITEVQAEQIYRKVTGFMSMPSLGRDDAIKIICDIALVKGDATADYILPYFKKYIVTKGKTGRTYSKNGYGFLDYAVTETMPQDYVEPPARQSNFGKVKPAAPAANLHPDALLTEEERERKHAETRAKIRALREQAAQEGANANA